jgi:primosomal protein N'
MSDPKTMSDSKRFVVCIRNDEYEGALELRKIYEVLDDPDAEPQELIRLVDESGEDYLYPRDWFLPLQLPHNVEQAIVEIAQRQPAA